MFDLHTTRNSRRMALCLAVAACLAFVACSGGTPDYSTTSIVEPARPGLYLLAGNSGGLGNVDANGTAARFREPTAIASDTAGNIYVADSGAIRKITAAGEVTTLAGKAGVWGSADGSGAAAAFNKPGGLAIDAAGNLYVADTINNTIRKITPEGMVSTLAGSAGSAGATDGSGAQARFSSPAGLAVDAAGNVYVADTNNYTIRKITPAGMVSTLAGSAGVLGSDDGSAANARFGKPLGVAIDAAGNLYVAAGKAIRKIAPDGMVSTLAGDTWITGTVDAAGTQARFYLPEAVAVDGAGNVYVLDYGAVRKVTAAGNVTTLAGSAGKSGDADGIGAAASFRNPAGLTADAAGNLLVSDSFNGTIRKVTAGGLVTTFAGKVAGRGYADGNGAAALLDNPYGVVGDASGNLYVSDTDNRTIRKISKSGAVSTLAGDPAQYSSIDGTGTAAAFARPQGIAIDAAGNLYVADANAIRKITQDGIVSTLAGTSEAGSADGIGAAARFSSPKGVALDTAGNVYVADSGNHAIRRITQAGKAETVAGGNGNGSSNGSGAAAMFSAPEGLTIDAAGNLYVADTGNHQIRKITAAGLVSTFAGSTEAGSADGTATQARFNAPRGLAIDAAGILYVADSFNHAIRRIAPNGEVSTVAGVAGRKGILLGRLPGGLDLPYGVAVIAPNILALTSGNSVLELVLP